MARVAPPQQSLVDRLGGLPAILIALWLAVALALFVSRMIAFHRDRRAILARSMEAGRVGAIRIIRTAEVVSPVALGIARPIIAVPWDFDRRYAPRERRLVLEHELAHHRSGDLVANLFAFVLLCLQWFNPLAWVAHAAFRFDQEAACDARVLDKDAAADRADYGRAIAKAASGRAFLFASALDRRNTLQRRLQSMLRSSDPTRRLAGRLLVVTGVAAALPLTASRAVDYVDVPAPAHAVAVAPAASPAAAVPVAPAPKLVASAALATPHPAPVPNAVAAAMPVSVAAAVAAPAPAVRVRGDDNLTINDDLVTIDGVTKRWEDLTPPEKARVRAAVAKATEALAKTHIDQARIMREVAAIPNRARLAEMQHELARTHASISQSVRRMDERAARERAAGLDPDQLDAAVRATLQSVQAVDLQAAERALATVDQEKIAESVANAEQSMQRARDELARIQVRLDSDQRQ
jgi:hypothetical protein